MFLYVKKTSKFFNLMLYIYIFYLKFKFKIKLKIENNLDVSELISTSRLFPLSGMYEQDEIDRVKFSSGALLYLV